MTPSGRRKEKAKARRRSAALESDDEEDGKIKLFTCLFVCLFVYLIKKNIILRQRRKLVMRERVMAKELLHPLRKRFEEHISH